MTTYKQDILTAIKEFKEAQEYNKLSAEEKEKAIKEKHDAQFKIFSYNVEKELTSKPFGFNKADIFIHLESRLMTIEITEGININLCFVEPLDAFDSRYEVQMIKPTYDNKIMWDSKDGIFNIEGHNGSYNFFLNQILYFLKVYFVNKKIKEQQ